MYMRACIIEKGESIYNKFGKDKFLLWLSYHELKTGTIGFGTKEREKAKVD